VGGAGALALAVVVMLIATIARARDAAAHEEELIPQPAPVPPMKTPAAEGDLPTTPEDTESMRHRGAFASSDTESGRR